MDGTERTPSPARRTRALHSEHADRLWACAQSAARGELEEAEDLLQEMWARLDELLPEDRRVADVPAYLCGYLHRMADKRRVRAARRTSLLAASPLPLPRSPEDRLLAGIDWSRTLGRLPREEAEILLWRYEEDVSYREIGERLGATESTARVRVHRARARARKLLGGEGGA